MVGTFGVRSLLDSRRRVLGCTWLMRLTDRAHSIGLPGIRTKGVLTFLTFWDFYSSSVAGGQRRGLLMMWFWVFNAGSCFETYLEVSLCQSHLPKWTRPPPSPAAAPVGAVPLSHGFPSPRCTRAESLGLLSLLWVWCPLAVRPPSTACHTATFLPFLLFHHCYSDSVLCRS